MRYLNVTLLFALIIVSSIVQAEKQQSYQTETLVEGLDFPWSIAFLPKGEFLLSLRGGELLRVSADGKAQQQVKNTPATLVAGQGGYFDVLLDPEFESNATIYLSYAHGTKNANATRVLKAQLVGDKLENATVIFTVDPLKDRPVHYGGRMVILPDNTLLLTSGEGFDHREASQDAHSQLGKVLRLNLDGSVPDDNPFADGETGDPYVYSLGHRNPQGLIYDNENNRIIVHEHGPKGGDEINIVTKGANYGWPAATYGINYSGSQISPHSELPGMVSPIKYWVPSIAPSGFALYQADLFPEWQGSLLVGALVDREVRRLFFNEENQLQEEELFSEIDARIRDVRVGPKGAIYLLTDSNVGTLVRISPRLRSSAQEF